MKTMMMLAATGLLAGTAHAQVGGTAGGTTGAVGAPPPVTYTPPIGAMPPAGSTSATTGATGGASATATARSRSRGVVGSTVTTTAPGVTPPVGTGVSGTIAPGTPSNGRVGALAPGATASPAVTGNSSAGATPPR